MANVTVGRNTPTAYDIRMGRLRTQAGAASSVPTGRAAPGGSGSGAGGVGGLVNTLGQSSVYASLLNAGANAWTGFRKTPQGQLFTDRVGEALSAPARLVNSFVGGQNPLSSASGGVRLGQFNPSGFDPSKLVTGSDLVQSAQAVNKYFPRSNTDNSRISDRNYEAEKSRIAQQTAQNPLFQKYQVADLTKQYNTASSPAEKQRIGLEIWAQSNPLLAAKLKSGQVGYAESRTAPGMSNAGGSPIGGLPMPTTQFDAAAAMAPGMTMEQTFGTALPGVGMVSSTPQVFNPGVPQGPLTDGMIEASYGQRLFASPDFVKVAKDKAFLQQAYRQQGL
jgi:hypothetical protein